MSNWSLGSAISNMSMGDGFAKMSQLAESAAHAAAAAKADAEAKLVASLNADAPAKAAGGKPAGGEGEGGGLDFTSMPRKELEEVRAHPSISSSAISTIHLCIIC